MELGVLEVWVNAITLHTPLALGLPGESVLEPGELSDESLAWALMQELEDAFSSKLKQSEIYPITWKLF